MQDLDGFFNILLHSYEAKGKKKQLLLSQGFLKNIQNYFGLNIGAERFHMGSGFCQVLSGNIIWAHFSRVHTLRELPELFVLSSHFLNGPSRWSRQRWVTLRPTCQRDVRQVTSQLEASQDHDVQILSITTSVFSH